MATSSAIKPFPLKALQRTLDNEDDMEEVIPDSEPEREALRLAIKLGRGGLSDGRPVSSSNLARSSPQRAQSKLMQPQTSNKGIITISDSDDSTLIEIDAAGAQVPPLSSKHTPQITAPVVYDTLSPDPTTKRPFSVSQFTYDPSSKTRPTVPPPQATEPTPPDVSVSTPSAHAGPSKVRTTKTSGRPKRIQPNYDLTDAQLDTLGSCPLCRATWTTRKGAKAKLDHIRKCATQNLFGEEAVRDILTIELENVRVLIAENGTVQLSPPRVKGPKGKRTAVMPIEKTLLEAAVDVSKGRVKKRFKKKTTDIVTTVKTVTDTHISIMDRANSMLSTSSATAIPFADDYDNDDLPSSTPQFAPSKLASTSADVLMLSTPLEDLVSRPPPDFVTTARDEEMRHSSPVEIESSLDQVMRTATPLMDDPPLASTSSAGLPRRSKAALRKLCEEALSEGSVIDLTLSEPAVLTNITTRDTLPTLSSLPPVTNDVTTPAFITATPTKRRKRSSLKLRQLCADALSQNSTFSIESISPPQPIPPTPPVGHQSSKPNSTYSPPLDLSRLLSSKLTLEPSNTRLSIESVDSDSSSVVLLSSIPTNTTQSGNLPSTIPPLFGSQTTVPPLGFLPPSPRSPSPSSLYDEGEWGADACLEWDGRSLSESSSGQTFSYETPSDTVKKVRKPRQKRKQADENVVAETSKSAKAKARMKDFNFDEAFEAMILGDEKLHLKVLRYEPLKLEDLVERTFANDITCTHRAMRLKWKAFLDAKSIAFYATEEGRNRKAAKRK